MELEWRKFRPKVAICLQFVCNMFAILVSQRQESEESRNANFLKKHYVIPLIE